jgi:hypothetical protein
MPSARSRESIAPKKTVVSARRSKPLAGSKPGPMTDDQIQTWAVLTGYGPLFRCGSGINCNHFGRHTFPDLVLFGDTFRRSYCRCCFDKEWGTFLNGPTSRWRSKIDCNGELLDR